MRIDTYQDSKEVRAALITAVSRVYAAGLQASGNGADEVTRREHAGKDVDAFLAKLASLGS